MLVADGGGAPRSLLSRDSSGSRSSAGKPKEQIYSGGY
jgi:hypothetical protein